MIEVLTDLRKSGEVPWDWIIDETRKLRDFTGSATIKDWLLSVLPQARLDPWNGDEPLILTESRSLAGVLENLCREYAVQVAATNCQAGGLLHTDIVPILRPFHRILYLGDFDLSGNLIEANTRSVLELQWERLALTAEQLDQYDLPRIVKHDRRYKDGGAHEAVETEALSQRIIVEILRNRLEELLPEPLGHVQERADQERVIIREALEG